MPIGNTDKLKFNLADSKAHQTEDLKDVKDNIKSLTQCILNMTQQIKQMKNTMLATAKDNQDGSSKKQNDLHYERM